MLTRPAEHTQPAGSPPWNTLTLATVLPTQSSTLPRKHVAAAHSRAGTSGKEAHQHTTSIHAQEPPLRAALRQQQGRQHCPTQRISAPANLGGESSRSSRVRQQHVSLELGQLWLRNHVPQSAFGSYGECCRLQDLPGSTPSKAQLPQSLHSAAEKRGVLQY